MRFFITLIVLYVVSGYTAAKDSESELTAEYKTWLKEKFSDQHERLIPIVAVADIYFACNRDKNLDPNRYPIKQLVLRTDKDALAEKLTACLGNLSVKSEVAVNYGLQGCFEAQLSQLPLKEKRQKMKLVNKAIASLSLIEKQKSFGKCVTQQAIQYLR